MPRNSKFVDDLLQLCEEYQNECAEWFRGNEPASKAYPVTIKGTFHSNDRYRFAMDHPYRSGFFKRALKHWGLWQDSPLQKSSFVVDLAHDLSKLVFGGAALTSFYVWWTRVLHPEYNTPVWADRILVNTRFFRTYIPLVAGGTIYFGVYNYLTGVLDWPVTKHEDMRYGASFTASFVVSLIYSMGVKLNENLRPTTPFDSRFARFYRSIIVFWAYFYCYNFALAYGYDGSLSHPRTNQHSYIYQLTNPPGYNIVRQMPYLPYYKESPAYPHTDNYQIFAQPWLDYYVRNPYYDPEYTAKAKAQAQHVLANYRI